MASGTYEYIVTCFSPFSLKSEWGVAAQYCHRLYKESKWSKVSRSTPPLPHGGNKLVRWSGEGGRGEERERGREGGEETKRRPKKEVD